MLSELWSDLWYRLRALFRRDALDRDLDDELRFHLERETEKHVRGGLPHDQALRRARLAFGGVNRMKDDTRDARGLAFVEATFQDLRYAARGLRMRPGFTAAVVVTLGLGIGANAAMFGVVDRLLFRAPAMLREPELVHRVNVAWTERGADIVQRHVQYRAYRDLAEWTTSFSTMAAFTTHGLAVGTGDDAREMEVGIVSASFFDFFMARPVLGRFFTPAEDSLPAGDAVAVISYAFWQTRFAGRADVLGQKLQVERLLCTIIGVAPEGFVGVNDEGPPALFVPVTTYGAMRSADFYSNYGWDWLQVMARRKAGVTVDAATADLSNAFQRSWNAMRAMERSRAPIEIARPRAIASPVQLGRGPEAPREARLALWVAAVAVVVMLIACANVGNLLLARALRRRREIALRLALGVSRGRLFRQLLTESLALAALGGVAGVLAAQWGGAALRASFLTNDEAMPVLTDSRTLAFAAVATLAAALLSGLVPAVQAGREDLAATLKTGARDGGGARARTRSVLLVFQGTLSVVLLIGAGLFVRSMQHVGAFRIGYDVDRVLFVQGNTRGATLSRPERIALNARLVEAARAVPGVVQATPTQTAPFLSGEGRTLRVAGIDSVRRLGRFALEAGSPELFATMGTRIVRGRGFTSDDRANAPRVAIVNEAMAAILWPGRDAIGQCFQVGADTMPCTEVVGVAENIRTNGITAPPEFHYYLPMAQYEATFGPAFPWSFVRVNGRPADLAETIRRRLQREMPGDGYVTAMPLRSLIERYQRPWRLGATMFVAFGALALVLASIGLYSVIAYNVTQRTHELGVRIALGAQVGDIVGLIVARGVALAAAGVVIGGGLALWAGRWVAPLLFAQSPRDPIVFGGVAVVLLAVAVVASAAPALRASRVDPNDALRAD